MTCLELRAVQWFLCLFQLSLACPVACLSCLIVPPSHYSIWSTHKEASGGDFSRTVCDKPPGDLTLNVTCPALCQRRRLFPCLSLSLSLSLGLSLSLYA